MLFTTITTVELVNVRDALTRLILTCVMHCDSVAPVQS